MKVCDLQNLNYCIYELYQFSEGTELFSEPKSSFWAAPHPIISKGGKNGFFTSSTKQSTP